MKSKEIQWRIGAILCFVGIIFLVGGVTFKMHANYGLDKCKHDPSYRRAVSNTYEEE